jgi:hypothetical protein
MWRMSESQESGDGYASPEWDWDEKYHAELAELYKSFVECGECLFGQSFHQFSSYASFVTYVQASTVNNLMTLS